jgi:hypothetical protein
MINKNLIPQVVVDYAEKMLGNDNIYVRQNFYERLENIKKFCELAMAQFSKKK